jgi:hypothetical protein
MPQVHDLTGMRFGKLTVLARDGHKRRNVAWLCACDCGNFTTVTSRNLKTGHTGSCGHLRVQGLVDRNFKHGMGNKRSNKVTYPLYFLWGNIKSRCLNPNNRYWKNYGGRGITVCERWHTFENFYADVKALYVPGWSIDRIDNDRGYEPGNVRWVTASEQARNRRSRERVRQDDAAQGL